MWIRPFIIWFVLVATVALEVLLFASPTLDYSTKFATVLSIATVQSLIVAVMLQRVLSQPASVRLLYLLSALIGVGLLIGMIVSVIR